MPSIQVGDPDSRNATVRAERGGCHACPVYTNCLFHRADMGGFKGQGPHNIGYRLITDISEGESAKEDFMSCENFVNVLQDRMLTGDEERMRGRPGEFVSVVAQEGEIVRQRVSVAFNSRGQVIKPTPNLVEPLKKKGFEVNLDDRSPAIDFDTVTVDVVVPKFKPKSKAVDDWSTELKRDEIAHRANAQSTADEAWERARAKQVDVKPKATAEPA